MKDQAFIAELDQIAIAQHRLLNALAVHQGTVGALQILQVPEAIIEPESSVATRDRATGNNKIIAIGAPNRRHILMEAERATGERPTLQRQAGQHHPPLSINIAILYGLAIG